MISGPTIESRNEQLFTAGIRTQVPMPELESIIQPLHGETRKWLEDNGIAITGAPYIRYYFCDLDRPLDVEIGWLVDGPFIGNDRILSSVIPSGEYATLIYTGHYDGLFEATDQLEKWAQRNGVKWDRRPDEHGEFQSRFELYITDPGDEPDPQKWETVIIIKVAE